MMGSINRKLFVYLMRQDDPRKCTSARLSRFKLAVPVHKWRPFLKNSVALNPFSTEVFFPGDKVILERFGVIAIDCSWAKVQEVFSKRFKGKHLRLPTLIAANPINYGHPQKLSTAEALSAALFIANFRREAESLMRVFKWGPTFIQLNHQPLKEYSLAKSREEMSVIESEYFSNINLEKD